MNRPAKIISGPSWQWLHPLHCNSLNKNKPRSAHFGNFTGHVVRVRWIMQQSQINSVHPSTKFDHSQAILFHHAHAIICLTGAQIVSAVTFPSVCSMLRYLRPREGRQPARQPSGARCLSSVQSGVHKLQIPGKALSRFFPKLFARFRTAQKYMSPACELGHFFISIQFSPPARLIYGRE